MSSRTYRVEDGDTLIVVQVRRQVVDTDRVGAKLLQDDGITETGLGVAERVGLAGEARRATGLVSISFVSLTTISCSLSHSEK